MENQFTFEVNDYVIYPTHGVGRIVEQEVQVIGGNKIDVFVISFEKEKMTLRVPVHRASACGLRPLSNEQQLEKVFAILRGKAKVSKGMWSRRQQEYETKINSGDIIAIAEVVRDLYKNVKDDRSYSERTICESALNRLASEYAVIKHISLEEAIDNITEFIS